MLIKLHINNNADEQGFDSQYGGFDGLRGIKFPQPSRLFFLHRVYALFGNDSDVGSTALQMSLYTLDCMAAGGINDHISGGFARYTCIQITYLHIHMYTLNLKVHLG
jgi:uncharacterized protein YyaL (SSP411 family)